MGLVTDGSESKENRSRREGKRESELGGQRELGNWMRATGRARASAGRVCGEQEQEGVSHSQRQQKKMVRIPRYVWLILFFTPSPIASEIRHPVLHRFSCDGHGHGL